MHDYLAPATLLTAILAGIWLNRRDYSNLKADVNDKFADLKADSARQFAEVNRRLGLIEADQKQFYTVTGKLDGRLDEVAKRYHTLRAFSPKVRTVSAAGTEPGRGVQNGIDEVVRTATLL